MPTTITPQQVEARVVEAIATFGPDPAEVTLDASFEALDVDSLDLVELSQIVQEEFRVELTADDMPRLKTVGDAVRLVTARLS